MRYRVSPGDPRLHRFHVTVTVPEGEQTLTFPSWAPGSYLMREFARNARDIRADREGVALPVERLDRHHWRVSGPCTLRYEVYAREKSVRTPFLDEHLGFFVPTNLLVHAADQGAATLEVEVPEGWVASCPLGEPVTGPALARWEARDVDHLYDAPVALGPFSRRDFTVRGVPHRHFIERGHNGDEEKMAVDLARIVETTAGLFGGGVPYPAYDLVTLTARTGHGGLEHKDGAVLLRPRLSFREPKEYEEFVTLAAHEHFHAWNVKRIHPDTLGPRFRYDREHHTRDLWWLEGGTVYYEERVAYGAGLVSQERHLKRLADLWARYLATPGRRHQSLEDSSWDAWIKLYRPGEDSPNSGISYYLKGAVVILAMDLELRHRSGRSTDDLMRALWDGWGRHGRGYPEGTVRRLATQLAGDDGTWAAWWEAHICGTAEVAMEAALDHAGIDVVAGAAKPGSWLGAELDGLVVASVREDGPAAGALTPGDELIAIDGERIVNLADRLRDIPPGTRIDVLLARDGRIVLRSLKTGMPHPSDLNFVLRNAIDEAQRRVRFAWLVGLSPAPS
jgi:predicted metalloprotease with PDZ domain